MILHIGQTISGAWEGKAIVHVKSVRCGHIKKIVAILITMNTFFVLGFGILSRVEIHQFKIGAVRKLK